MSAPQGARPEELAGQVFRGSAAVRDGLLTAHQLRGNRWQRLGQDVYADARLDRDHLLRCRALALRLPATAVFAGPSAAYLHGVPHAARFEHDAHVIAPRKVRVGHQRGLRAHTTALDPIDITVRAGFAVTTPERTAWDVAAWLDLTAAVQIIDGLLYLGLVDHAGLAEQLARTGLVPVAGSRRARQAFALADGRAQGPAESVLRIRLVAAGLPRPVPHHPIPLPGGLIVYPDLAWPEYRVAVDYDGSWQLNTDQLHRDRLRLNQLGAAGWAVLHVTSHRLERDFPAIVREVRQALRSRGYRPDL